MGNEMSYLDLARQDAWNMFCEFADEMIEQFTNDGEISTDLNNDYPNGDSYHHENHVDKEYSLLDAARVLDELSNYTENDAGLWEGLEPRRAISAQAAYTYGNAVYDLWRDTVATLDELLQSFDDFEDEDEDAPEPKTAEHQRGEFARRFVTTYILLHDLEQDPQLSVAAKALVAQCYEEVTQEAEFGTLPILADALDDLDNNGNGVPHQLRKLGRMAV